MSRHNDAISLRQMLDHVQEAIALASGRARRPLQGQAPPGSDLYNGH